MTNDHGAHEMDTQAKHGCFVNVFGRDHPGVLASVILALDAVDGSIESARKTVVDGYFTMLTAVIFPRRWSPLQLARALKRNGPHDWKYSVLAQHAMTAQQPSGGERTGRFAVTVWGEGQPGIASRLDTCLAAKGILMAELLGEWDGAEFVLVAYIDVPSDLPFNTLQTELEKLAEELECEVKVQDFDVFLAAGVLSATDLHDAQSIHRVPSRSCEVVLAGQTATKTDNRQLV
jgi:predicted amino acid-binding ACT domain protein